MNRITLTICGNEYEFAYSKDFRFLKKREDGGTEFYPFRPTAYWTPLGGESLTKKDVMALIKEALL